MPTLNCGHNSRDALVDHGPTIYVQIGCDPTFVEGGTPDLPQELHPALVDTGAWECAIDVGLAKLLGLQVIDRRPLGGIHGERPVDVVIAQIHLPRLSFTMFGPCCAVEIGTPHRALLGRTFLQYFQVAYDGMTGAVTLTGERFPT
jgi:hypothetical protein